MRKFLLSAIALLMTATMLAVGNGSGSSQANAIDFDWDGEHYPKKNAISWFSIKLSNLSKEAEDPTVALYLTNLTNETANVELSGSAILKFPYPLSLFVKDIDLMQLAGTNATEHYSIAGKKHVVWTLPTTYDLSTIGEGQAKDALEQMFGDLSRVSLVQLVEYGLNDVALSIYPDQEIVVSADVYETEEIIDDACTKAVDFDWAGETVAAGETWFYLDLNAVKNTDKKLNFVVENNGGVDANVAFDLYGDCPASAILLDYDWTIAAGAEVKEALGRFFLDQMKKDYVYLKLTTNQTITLKAEEEVLPPPVELFDPSVAPVLEIGKKYALNGETVLKVNLEALKAPFGYKTVCKIENPNANPVNLKQEIAYSTPVTSNNVQVINLPVVTDTTLAISSKAIAGVKSDVAYFRLTTAETLNLVIEYVQLEASKPVDPSTPSVPSAPAVLAPTCDDSYAFDWNSSVKQKALMTKWYELDIASLVKNEEHVQLSFTNHHNAVVLVMGSILLDCNSTDTIPFICPVPAGKSISKVVDYSLLATSPLGKAYVSLTMMPTSAKSLADFASVRSQADLMNFVSMDFGAEIEIAAKRISALVDPSYCEATYQTLEKGVDYVLEPGKTQWYRVTGEFLKDLGLLEKLTIINNGKKDANVTFGVTVDCKYGIATTLTQTVPTWFDLTSYYPSGLYQLATALTDKEISEFYLSVKSDQPMLFGFGLDHGTMLGCDDAIRFNWEKGAVINRFDAQWYNFDLNDIKGSGKHLKLTFTNPTDEIVWVASMASLTCPLKVVAPAIVPVLPGMSVDKVIDYSFVATTPINNVYVAVVASDKLELGAALIDATVEEPVSCINHVEVKSGERYIHKPGTTWYKFSNDLLAQMGSAPRFTFENLSSNAITFTVGMTVDCEYGILTKAKGKIPAHILGQHLHNREFGVHIPREFFQAVRKLIDSDVTELMFQLTANNPFAFSIDMKAGDGCNDAQDFSWKGCFDLEANKDAWYKVDVNKALKSTEPISVGLYNNTNSPVTITAEVSPTCPAMFSMTEKFVLGAYDTIEVSVQPAKIQELVKDYSKYLNNMSCYARFHADGDVTVCVNDSKEPVTPPNPDEDEPCCPEECEGVTPLDWRMVTLSQVELNKLYKLDITGLYNQNTINFFVNNDLQKGDVWVESEIYKHCQEAPIAQHSNKVAAGFSMAQVAHDKFAALVDAKQCCMFVKFTSMDTVPVTPPTPCTPYEVKDDVYMCEGQSYVWPVNGVTYTDNAYVKEPGKDASGCDVTYILDLTVAAGQTKSVEVCEGDLPYIYKEVDGTEHSLATVGLHEITLVDGCSMYIDLSTKDCSTPEPGTDCENAPWLDWKNGIKLSDLKKGWYKLDVSDVHAAGTSIQVVVENDLAGTATVTASALTDCDLDIADVLFDGSKSMAQGTKTPLVSYPDFSAVVAPHINTIYVEIQSITIEAGEDCENATLLDWRKGIRLSQLSQGWYKLDVSDVHANQENVNVTIINDLKCVATLKATAYTHCEDGDVLYEGNQALELGETVAKVSYSEFASAVAPHLDYVYVNVESIVEDCEEEPKPCYETTTIVVNDVCDGTEFVDPITGEKHIISTLIPSTLTWNDTVKTGLTCDSIYTYVVDPIVAPEMLTKEELVAIGAAPVLIAGEVVVTDGTEDIIKAHYNALTGKNIAHVENVVWTVGAKAELPCDATEHTMVLTIYAGCEFVVSGTYVFGAEDIISVAIKKTTETATICEGETYPWGDGEVSKTGTYSLEVKNEAGCVVEIKTLELTVTPASETTLPAEEVTICESELPYIWNVNGKSLTINAAGEHTDAVIANCEKVISVLQLTVTPVSETTLPAEEVTICESELPYIWNVNGKALTITAAGEHTDDVVVGCEKVISVLQLTVTPVSETTLPAEEVTICESELPYIWNVNGKSLTINTAGEHTDAVIANCEKVISVLQLTVTPVSETTLPAEEVTICENELPYIWNVNGKALTITAAGEHTDDVVVGCEKVISVLQLTVTPVSETTLPAEEITICESELPYIWNVNGKALTITAAGEHTDDVVVGCEKLISVLQLTVTPVSETTLPAEEVTICESELPYVWNVNGKALTITEAGEYTDAVVVGCEKLISVLQLTVNTPVTTDVTVTECYAYTWNGETYTETGEYTYTTVAANGCDSIVTLHLTITAETPEDNPALGEAEAVAKYGNRMIVLHLNGFAANYGWTPANGQVTWYQVVGEIDNSWEIVDDQVLGTGMYIENLDGFAGQIYAIIDSSNADACGNLYRTNVLVLTANGLAPKLMPTVARPNENLHLLNLNSSEVTEVRVFSTSGELMETYNAEQVSEFVFKAATLPGYYLVEVQHNGEQTTLRYIVK